MYEFNGCYFHHHECFLTAYITDATCKWLANSKQIRKRDQKRAEYIKNQGYDIEITRECEYHQLLNACPEFKEFIETQRQQRPLEHRITLTEQEMLSAIRDKKKYLALSMLTCMFPITFSITLAKCLLFFVMKKSLLKR